MTLATGPNLGLLVHGAAAEEHYEALMQQWRGLDVLVQSAVIDRLAAPPSTPADGDAYIVIAAATGAWTGHENKLARWNAANGANAWEFFTPKAGWETFAVADGVKYRFNGTSWEVQSQASKVIPIACSDETTVITAGAAKVTFRMPFAMTLSEVRASLTEAQGGGSIFTVDINEGGASVLSTKLTIDNTEKTSKTAAAAAVVSDAALADDAEITIDVDQVGDGTAKGLKVYLIGA